MTASVRERLLVAIVAAVGGVYGLPTPEDERDLPVTIVQDGIDTWSDSYDTTLCTLPLNVGRAELAASSTRDAQRTQAHAALAALITAMYTDPTFGGLATSVSATGGGIQLEAGKFVFAEATFTVFYQHLRGQPAVIS